MKLAKSFAVAGVALLATLSLSGCLRMQADVYVSPNATVDKVGVTVGLNKAAIEGLASMGGGEGQAPTDLQSFKDSFIKSSTEDGSQTAEEIQKQCEFTENNEEYLATCTYDSSNANFNEMVKGLDGDVTLKKDGNTITASLKTNATDESASMLGGAISVQTLVHFPGKVQSVTGAGAAVSKSDPNTVVIDMAKTDGGTITAKADASNTGPILTFLLYFLFGFVVLAGAVVLAAWILKKRGDTGPVNPFEHTAEATTAEPVAEPEPVVEAAAVEVVESEPVAEPEPVVEAAVVEVVESEPVAEKPAPKKAAKKSPSKAAPAEAPAVAEPVVDAPAELIPGALDIAAVEALPPTPGVVNDGTGDPIGGGEVEFPLSGFGANDDE